MAYYTWKPYKLNSPILEIFNAFKNAKNCFFLDSSLNNNLSLGRYSFLGCEPFQILSGSQEAVLPKLRNELNKYKILKSGSEPKCSDPKHASVPFLGGALGYLAYPKSKGKGALGVPEALFAFYNTILIVDHLKNNAKVFCIGFPEKNERLQKALCRKNLERMDRLLADIPALGIETGRQSVKMRNLKSNLSRAIYISAVKKAKKYIKAGDIYQVNLSQRFEAECNLSAAEIYARLRRVSPSYFGSYFDAGRFQIISSSPECFLKLKDGVAITRPMKGTRPRSQDRREDKRLKNDLIKSPKDKAELVMIVDLERNDLGRVCNYDSIKVNPLREVEEYSTVFQTISSVSGRLFKDKDRIDLLRACSPGGSITGCPKIRAMQIIEELEPNERSIYTGSFGYLSFSQEMQMSILIRSILKKGNKIYFGAGGGIVADSKPEEEYNETLIKVRGIMQALEA
ncbi:MAG: anthranilate synthase component I family protein [Candidatus Omnitrophota bacterium]|jgi:para-aminobenzoate synthetase component 1